jgi:uncharacterized damage-inducible protein DinB
MTYYGAKELAASFRTVRNNTITIADEIPEDKYGFSPAPGARTVAQMLVHITSTTRFPLQFHGTEKRMAFEGFDFMPLMNAAIAAEQNPGGKAAIVAALRSEGDQFAQWLEGLSDAFLSEQVKQMPGQQPAAKSRFEMILGIKEHEMHHRGQLMLVERMLGITPHLTRQREAMMAQMMAART